MKWVLGVVLLVSAVQATGQIEIDTTLPDFSPLHMES